MRSTQNQLLGRVIGQEKELYRVQLENQKTFQAYVPGRFIYSTHSRAEFPAVGDWVICEPTGNDQRLLITTILNRKSLIERATDTSESQVIAANVDYLFIATSHNHDLNERRLERYVTLAYNAGCSPVTVAVVGSSGVGKSTLVNRLIGDEILATQDIREDDSKGRHTTSSRNLFATKSGALVIDTPGMRELQLTGDDEGLGETFSDLEGIASSCKFTDCAHQTEPGCKILQSLADGTISPKRWQSYQKLLREIRFQQRKSNKALAKEERDSWKKIHKDMRANLKLKK